MTEQRVRKSRNETAAAAAVSRFGIALIRGDGIGIDVADAAMAVAFAASGRIGGIELVVDEPAGAARYYRETGRDMAPGAEEAAGAADAIFVGAIGWPDVRHADGRDRTAPAAA